MSRHCCSGIHFSRVLQSCLHFFSYMRGNSNQCMLNWWGWLVIWCQPCALVCEGYPLCQIAKKAYEKRSVRICQMLWDCDAGTISSMLLRGGYIAMEHRPQKYRSTSAAWKSFYISRVNKSTNVVWRSFKWNGAEHFWSITWITSIARCRVLHCVPYNAYLHSHITNKGDFYSGRWILDMGLVHYQVQLTKQRVNCVLKVSRAEEISGCSCPGHAYRHFYNENSGCNWWKFGNRFAYMILHHSGNYHLHPITWAKLSQCDPHSIIIGFGNRSKAEHDEDSKGGICVSL